MAKKAKGDLLMFVHQDMELCDDYFLNKVDSIFKENDNLGIVGVLGRKNNEIIGNMNTLTTNSLVSPHHIDTLTTVNSLDECLFVIPKSIVLKYHLTKSLSSLAFICRRILLSYEITE